MIIFVVAYGQNYEMGKDGHLPWRGMKSDLARYRRLTRGKTIVMGGRTFNEYKDIHKTFEHSKIIVLSHNLTHRSDVEVVDTVESIVGLSQKEDVYVIGGANVFSQLLPYASKMYITIIHHSFSADVFFPEFSEDEWQKTSSERFLADSNNPYDYTFVEFTRLSKR